MYLMIYIQSFTDLLSNIMYISNHAMKIYSNENDCNEGTHFNSANIAQLCIFKIM